MLGHYEEVVIFEKSSCSFFIFKMYFFSDVLQFVGLIRLAIDLN